MRYAIYSIAFLVCAGGGALAEPDTIVQTAKTNYAVIVIGNKSASNIKVKQTGNINGIASSQKANENAIATSQSGWRNTVVIYQEGWTDTSSVIQFGPSHGGGNGNLPTTFRTQSTDEGYLSYFQSGGFSIVTLTDPTNTITSRFGRSR